MATRRSSSADPPRAAWVLNLDADLELAAYAAGRRYAPTQVVRDAMKPYAARLTASLVRPGDRVVDDTTPPGAARGLIGRAYCPTSRAIAMLVRAGATPVPHPPRDVLREVNGRAFCAALGQTLPGAVFARDLDEALRALARDPAPEIARAWRVKRAFGMAGRGQRTIAPRASEGDLAFLRAGILEGGVQIEPRVAIVRELGVHGVIDLDGSLELGEIVEQRCDAHGQWLGSEVATDVDRETSEAILGEARRAAAALREHGYFGPFGVDAFVYAGLDGAPRLQPRSEINARYSMGFSAGFRHGSLSSHVGSRR